MVYLALNPELIGRCALCFVFLFLDFGRDFYGRAIYQIGRFEKAVREIFVV